MSQTLYWFQGSACGGDTFALLDVESPDIRELLEMLDIEVLWHPSLSNGTPEQHEALVDAICAGEQKLDFLCVEGAVIRGPGGTGMYDTWGGRPKKDILACMAPNAEHLVAVGTCASFGGIGAQGEIEANGRAVPASGTWRLPGVVGVHATAEAALRAIVERRRDAEPRNRGSHEPRVQGQDDRRPRDGA